MDLVDIDKVLDDFELDEDKSDRTNVGKQEIGQGIAKENYVQHQKPQQEYSASDEATSLAAAATTTIQSTDNLQLGIPNENIENTSAQLNATERKTTINDTEKVKPLDNQTQPLTTNQLPSIKTYVNVSNVFHSLNEYVNASLEPPSSTEQLTVDYNVDHELQLDDNRTTSNDVEVTNSVLASADLSLATTNTTTTTITTSTSVTTPTISDENKEIISSISSSCYLNDEESDESASSSSHSTTGFSNEIVLNDNNTSSLSPLNDPTAFTSNTTDDDGFIDDVAENQNTCYEEMQISIPDNRDDTGNNIVMPSAIEIAATTTATTKSQPIHFESTMDDVSDTELESYLQELEMELEYKDIKLASSASVCLAATSAATTNSIPVDDKNPQNADSFSQASTVEFADVRLQSDFEPSPLTPGIAEDSNNVDQPDEHITETVPFIDDDAAAVENIPNNENEPVIESDTDIPICDYEKPIQRPNSLDLPSNIVTQFNDFNQNPEIEDTTDITPCEQAPPPPTTTPQVQDINETITTDQHADVQSPISTIMTRSQIQLGKIQPYWIPDNVTNFCMQCSLKFSLIKRRHHCRACGQVLCSQCCSLKARLEYMGGEVESRICVQCNTLLQQTNTDHVPVAEAAVATSTASAPNPNNPMEYCSVIPPHQQVDATAANSISVMVPVGVLKREGDPPKSNRKDKNVMFSDGIRPGCDLTDLDNWDKLTSTSSTDSLKLASKKGSPDAPQPQLTDNHSLPTAASSQQSIVTAKSSTKRLQKNKVKLPPIDPKNQSFIPIAEHSLPPIYTATRTEFSFLDASNDRQLMETLKKETIRFAVQRNLYVLVKIVDLTCCINKTVINFTTQGMHNVGQDEIVILLEMDDSNRLPKDVFEHLNDIYRDADTGTTIGELGFSMPNQPNFLGSKEHGGFLFIRSTFQCLQGLNIPENPFLIGILIHRWEVPWAKIFPLRLMLRLGALHRYYPCPHCSVRGRDSVYAEIAQTIINFLADFRTYSYTLPTIRGMYIHMKERTTSVLIPKNRYEQIIKALNDSSDHILALGGNFSKNADGHLVCIQNTESGCTESHSYSTQAVNIQGRPRIVTGASFFVLNGALKSSSGLSAKCSIVEDGLMVQILPTKMTAIQKALREMVDIEIICGPTEADATQTEIVQIQWVDNDKEFNVGVTSPIDNKPMDGIPAIRVHRGLEFPSSNHKIKWTEVFIIQSENELHYGRDEVNMSKLAEQIAKSTAMALVKYLDLLAASGFVKIGLRATLHIENVCYEAGTLNTKLGPLYMNALDNELIPTLHREATNLNLDTPIVIELIFHILDD